MITTNPFSELATSISAETMQIYVIAMVVLVIAGVLIDVVHKRSAQYFFENAKKAQKAAKRTVSGGEKAGLAIQTLTNEVLTSGEFKNPQRRMSHLLTMWGFIIFVVTTAMMIFGAGEGTTVPMLWHIGAAMLAVGGYWFWFFIRVDVSSEGNPWYRIVRGDLFIVCLLGMSTFALLWSLVGSGIDIFFVLFIAFSTVLFSTVIWSKFAHMFFKPAAAYQKKVTRADGSQENLPDVGDLSDPALQSRYPDIPTYMGDKPGYMGLGIKREAPKHF